MKKKFEDIRWSGIALNMLFGFCAFNVVAGWIWFGWQELVGVIFATIMWAIVALYYACRYQGIDIAAQRHSQVMCKPLKYQVDDE